MQRNEQKYNKGLYRQFIEKFLMYRRREIFKIDDNIIQQIELDISVVSYYHFFIEKFIADILKLL